MTRRNSPEEQERARERRADYQRAWRLTRAGVAARERRNVAARARRAAEPAPRRTGEQVDHWRDRDRDALTPARALRAFAIERGCSVCGTHGAAAMLSFYERPGQPTSNLVDLLANWPALEREIENRDALCFSCSAARTAAERPPKSEEELAMGRGSHFAWREVDGEWKMEKL